MFKNRNGQFNYTKTKGGVIIIIARLENTGFGTFSLFEDEIDKVIEFNTETGVSKIHTLQFPKRIPFDKTQEINLARELIKCNPNDSEIRVIRGLPISRAYSAPFKIYLDINQTCSLQCPFCLSGARLDAKANLPLSTIKKIATEISEMGIMYVKIGGGDPFLHPDFAEIINLLRASGCFITISTNSMTLTPYIAELLAKNKVRTSVSIEGMETTDDNLRGHGHFQKALDASDILKTAGVDVLLRTTLLRQNLKDIPKLVELAKNREVKIKFSYCRPAGRATYNQTVLEPKDSFNYIKVLKYLNDPKVLPYVLMDEGMMFNQPIELKNKILHGNICGAANRSMHIDPLGKVSPCVFLGPTFSFGKIYQDGPIKDFWQGKIGNKFQTVREIRQPHECDGCNRLCKNECPANRFYFWGNYQQQDPNCLYEALRKSEY